MKGSGARSVISQPALTSCIHVPMFETRFANQIFRKTLILSGLRLESVCERCSEVTMVGERRRRGRFKAMIA